MGVAAGGRGRTARAPCARRTAATAARASGQTCARVSGDTRVGRAAADCSQSRCLPGPGARCEAAACHPPCQHGGRCVAPLTCRCTQGRSGRFCQKCEYRERDRDTETQRHRDRVRTTVFEGTGPECHGRSGLAGAGEGGGCLLNCQNGGVCTKDWKRCTCKRGFFGDFCQKT